MLVITVPILLLVILAFITGSGDLGTPELAGLMLIWVVGLIWVWVVPLVRHMVNPKS
ncbi:MAG: hypothetical protein J2P22_16715 [Nocardioides sp.]|nr:hypothetical protein [Nocardioides sp.]